MLKPEELKEIIQIIDQSTINEFTYEKDGTKIKIRKPKPKLKVEQPQEVERIVTSTPIPVVEKEIVQPVEDSVGEVVTPTEEKSDDLNVKEIVSPMVGTFYRKPSPDSDNYVNVGDKIDETSVVCIVEAMKLFNEIEAEVAGEITEILVEDGELVEYGQPLFNVKTN